MLNYLKKFAVDIFPSVAATVIGAYIVNHYIVSRPNDAPTAAAVSAAKPDSKSEAASDPKPDVKADTKPEATAAVSNLPPAGVKAKGISEKAVTEKAAVVDRKADEKAEAKVDAKPETKPDAGKSEANRLEHKPAESHAAAPREKEKIRVVLPSPIQAVEQSANATIAPVAVPAPVAAATPVESVPAPAAEERRDANDLARAAIERLRANGDLAPRAAEAPPRAAEAPPRPAETPRAAEPVRAPEAPKVAHAPATVAAPMPAVRPLPPPIMVSGPPAGEPFGQAPSPARPPYVEARDPNRPVPPADIPLSRPLDLRAEAGEPSVRDRAASAAEDAFSTAKSIFHSVIPK